MMRLVVRGSSDIKLPGDQVVMFTIISIFYILQLYIKSLADYNKLEMLDARVRRGHTPRFDRRDGPSSSI